MLFNLTWKALLATALPVAEARAPQPAVAATAGGGAQAVPVKAEAPGEPLLWRTRSLRRTLWLNVAARADRHAMLNINQLLCHRHGSRLQD